MIKISFIVLLLTCFISLANCKLGALCFSQLTTATIKCMASQGIVNIMRYPRWPIQSTIKQDLYRIKNAGLGVDIYYQFNQDTIAPEQDVKWFLSQIQPGLVNRVWLHAFYGGARSRWQMNIARIQKYANLFIQNNFKTGIYTTYEAWQAITNGTQIFKSLPLFWQYYTDNNPSFDNYVPFGGWQRPVAKQFVTKSICGITSYVSWQP